MLGYVVQPSLGDSESPQLNLDVSAKNALKCAGYASYFFIHAVMGTYKTATGDSLLDSIVEDSIASAAGISAIVGVKKLDKEGYKGFVKASKAGVNSGAKTFLSLEAVAIAGYFTGVGIGLVSKVVTNFASEKQWYIDLPF